MIRQGSRSIIEDATGRVLAHLSTGEILSIKIWLVEGNATLPAQVLYTPEARQTSRKVVFKVAFAAGSPAAGDYQKNLP